MINKPIYLRQLKIQHMLTLTYNLVLQTLTDGALSNES